MYETEWCDLVARLNCSPDSPPAVILRRLKALPKAEANPLIRQWWKYLSPAAARRHDRMTREVMKALDGGGG